MSELKGLETSEILGMARRLRAGVRSDRSASLPVIRKEILFG
jgi:hypothetical protein